VPASHQQDGRISAPPPKPREATLPVELAEEPADVPRRVHILGTGSIGRLVAHSLRDLPNPPPVTLIFHTSRHWRNWQNSQKEITIRTEGISVARGGFDAELEVVGFRKHGKLVSKEEYINDDPVLDGMQPHENMEQRSDEDREDLGVHVPKESTNDEPIHNLILSVKAGITVPALLSVRHRLGPNSAILFLQNGMGQIDEVNEEVFPDPETRPSYLSGIISHGVHSHANMEATHAGFGTIAIGVPPAKPYPRGQAEISTSSSAPDGTSPTSRYLLRTICRSPTLAGVPNSPTELLQSQLDKLAANAIINPLTSLMDSRNGALTHNFALTRAMRLLLGEISLVIRSLPELSSLPNVATRFSPERLETLVVAIANRTSNNISSMLADTRAGNLTEIKYINGYIVRRGEEVGVTCYMNYLVVQLVRGKQQLISLEKQDELPLADAAKARHQLEDTDGRS
jgi:2-dehydropantoate 2-reductase